MPVMSLPQCTSVQHKSGRSLPAQSSKSGARRRGVVFSRLFAVGWRESHCDTRPLTGSPLCLHGALTSGARRSAGGGHRSALRRPAQLARDSYEVDLGSSLNGAIISNAMSRGHAVRPFIVVCERDCPGEADIVSSLGKRSIYLVSRSISPSRRSIGLMECRWVRRCTSAWLP